jgi:predicted CopG family antitoxin
MATRTISLRVEAYEKLRRARRYRDESFSEVVLRAVWPSETITGGELLARYQTDGPYLSELALERLEELKISDPAPADKWQTG